MKKIIFSLIFVSLSAAYCNAESGKFSQYKIDETAIDEQFDQSQDITSEVSELFIANSIPGNAKRPAFDSKQETAAIVSIVMVVLGVGVLVPVHRFILGTGGAGGKIFFAYFCTASGCGVGLMLDAIFLLINMDDTNYEDCSRIIMWRE